MTSFPVDVILLIALVLTTTCVVLVYRKLKVLEAHQADYQRVLAESASALMEAHRAVALLNTDGRELLFSLSGKIEQAHEAIAEMDRRNPSVRRARVAREIGHGLDLGHDGDMLPSGA